ncbi:MAG: adenylate/guanylate cyclase domain-containing protein [Holosporales bacterium]|jgi:adenylate cyclase|nr:adenylate/guanylate cyclase domain-containing protein [Holosporales bacterium]
MKIFDNRKLIVDVLAAFSLLLSFAVACEIFYSSYANKNLILKFEKEYYSNKVSIMASEWLDSYFKQLELVINILSKNVISNSEDGHFVGFSDFENLFKEGLKNTPFTLSFYVTLSDGSYLQVRHTDGLKTFQTDKEKLLPSYAKYAIRKMEFSPDKKLIESWEYLNEDFTSISKEYLKKIQYDPRKRGWYVKAELNKGVTWSDAYILITTKLPGVTLSTPIFNFSEKSIKGVIAIDFALTDFRELLKNVTTTENSNVYLINNKNEIIASSSNLKNLRENYEKSHISDSVDNPFVFFEIASCGDRVLQEAAKNLLGTNEYHSTFCVDGKGYVASIQKLTRLPVSILSIAPQSDFTEDFEKVQRSMFIISIFVFLLSVGVVFLLSKRISSPIVKLCKSAKAIEAMELADYPIPPKSKIFEIRKLAMAMDSMKLSVATFAKYAPKDLVKKLLLNGVQPEIGGKTEEITIMFSDIEKFSVVSEKLPAEYLLLHLSEYFDELTKKIMEYNGTIDKYIGDSIMAIWGVPNQDENHVVNACYAALSCQSILKKLKEKWAPLGKPSLPTRIGLHTGIAVVGNIGSQDRMNFTAIGDSVNIASRLEGANKVYETRILASESVESIAKNCILFRVIDKVAVKGRSSGIVIFEPLCAMKNAENAEYYKLIELSSKSKEAFELYQEKDFKAALRIYKEIAAAFPDKSKPIIPLINRCKMFISAPQEDWDGINRLFEK